MSHAEPADILKRLEKRVGSNPPSAIQTLILAAPNPAFAGDIIAAWLANSRRNSFKGLSQCSDEIAAAFLISDRSEWMREALMANPEIGDALCDPQRIGAVPTAGTVIGDGLRMLSLVSGYAVALDRLRALRQIWHVRIAINDFCGNWNPDVCREAQSSVADGLAAIALEASWREFGHLEDRHDECPVTIVAIAAWGRKAIGYSSPLRFLAIVPHISSPDEERAIRRYLDMFRRAICDPLERGALYDAQTWRHPVARAWHGLTKISDLEMLVEDPDERSIPLTLARSRWIVGPERDRGRIEGLLQLALSRQGRSSRDFDAYMDILSPGLNAWERASEVASRIRVWNPSDESRDLDWETYRGASRTLWGESVARPPLELQQRLDTAKRDYQTEDRITVPVVSLSAELPPGYDRALTESVRESIRTLAVRAAPALGELKHSTAFADVVVSGELMEVVPQTLALLKEPSVEQIAKAFRFDWSVMVAQAGFGASRPDTLGQGLSDLYDALIRHTCDAVGATFDVLALGDYAERRLSIGAPLDLLLLTSNAAHRDLAEDGAERWVAVLEVLSRWGVPLTVRFALREAGILGPRVRSFDGLSLYALAHLSTRDRFELGRARVVDGESAAGSLCRSIAFDFPLTPERMDQLLAEKHRSETEAVPAKYARRHVAKGVGGLSDVDWFVRLHEALYPTATDALTNITFDDRVRGLAKARLIHSLELEELRSSYRRLVEIQRQIALHGYPFDIVPENPDKLDRLASAFGLPDGNAFLATYERVADRVRAMFNEGIERLRA